MKLDMMALDLNGFEDIIDYVDLLLYNRPIPHREYDQIYMRAKYMLKQVTYVQETLKGKRIAFLGDGDGMSLLLALLSQRYQLGIDSMTVFDFDDRILNTFKSISKDYQLKIPIRYELYNVIDPISPNHRGQFDFFYINPPYGSKNHGLSCIMWLMRCMELSTVDSEGCIIIPNDTRFPWVQSCMENITHFLLSDGFQILQTLSNIHKYHLSDNPDLQSSMLHVKRISDCPPPYAGSRFPLSMCANLYGSTRAIPRYIYASSSNPYGAPDFNWEYGHIDNFPVAKSE